MTQVAVTDKPLAVNPLKVSQPMGASLAFLGLARSLPLEHGAQGCTAFSKVFFTRHFREPVPLQTTAMDHVVTVMGADANLYEALNNIATGKEKPDVVGVVTTGLAELQGADIVRTIKTFRQDHPEHADMAVVPVNSPDTLGSLESGFALAVEAMIRELVPVGDMAGACPSQVNVLASSMLTPGDIEGLREWIGAYGLRPVILPDLGDSLDGHLDGAGFSNLTLGGTPRSDFAAMGKSAVTLVIGASLNRAADVLKERTGIPDFRFEGLMGLADCDAFNQVLARISGPPVPRLIERQRAQLMDALVDCHFPIGGARFGIAADPDLLAQLARFVSGLGGDVVAAVASSRTPLLAELPCREVQVGDLEDLELAMRANGGQLLFANSHASPIARRLGVPLLRAGFPLYDLAGAHARQWIGYRGSRQAVFDLANLLAAHRQTVEPYRSIYWQGGPRDDEQTAADLRAFL